MQRIINKFRILKRIKQLEKTVEKFHSSHGIVENLLRQLAFIYQSGDNSSDFIRPRLEIGEEEHKKNVDNLFKNLDSNARQNLEYLISKIDKCFYNLVVPNQEILNQNEIDKMKSLQFFWHEIKQTDDYYEYKKFKLPINYFEPTVFLCKHNLDKLTTLNDIGNKAIIDAGAYIADSVLVFRDNPLLKNNPIYAFEPVARHYRLAQKTLALNNIENIVLENIALGNEKLDNIQMEDTIRMGGVCARVSKNKFDGNISMDTLDNYVKKHNIQVGLIKVDIEGFEQNFLQGAINTIKEQKPILLISIYHNYDDFVKIKPMIESWDLGYKFNFYKGVNQYVFGDILLFCEVD
jgi:FkbM family methyltransferase